MPLIMDCMPPGRTIRDTLPSAPAVVLPTTTASGAAYQARLAGRRNLLIGIAAGLLALAAAAAIWIRLTDLGQRAWQATSQPVRQLGRNMWRAKIWLIEGLAVYFEASEVKGRRLDTSVLPSSRLSNARRSIRSNSYVPLAQLIRMEQAQFGATHYAQAWSLIYFLVNGAKGGKKRFVEYWEKTKEGGYDPVKLFEELFHSSEALVQTPHEKLLLARSREVDWERFEKGVAAIEAASSEYDEPELRSLLVRLVPEYTHSAPAPAETNVIPMEQAKR